MSLLSRKQLMEALGIAPRTFTRRVAGGMPVAERRGKALFFDLEKVRAWEAEQGLDGTVGRPSGEKAIRTSEAHEKANPAEKVDGPLYQGRATAARADLAAKALRAKRADHELKVEQALPELGLGERVRAAESVADLVEVSREVSALLGDGKLSPSRARALKAMLSEMRLSLEMRIKHEPPPENPARVLLASSEAMQAARAIDWIVDDDRRDRVLAFVAAELEADKVACPNVDEGGL